MQNENLLKDSFSDSQKPNSQMQPEQPTQTTPIKENPVEDSIPKKDSKTFNIILIILSLVALIVFIGAAIGVYLLIRNNKKGDETNETNQSEQKDTNQSTSETTEKTSTSTTTTITETINNDEVTTVKVYLFDENKFNTEDEINYFTIVTRETSRKDIATFAVEEIIKGPNDSEKAQNLKPTFGENTFVEFNSDSNCSGNDFKINIENKKATVEFCKSTLLAGDMSGSLITDQITQTLKQFSTIDTVRVLNESGSCFNDMSGEETDECFH